MTVGILPPNTAYDLVLQVLDVVRFTRARSYRCTPTYILAKAAKWRPITLDDPEHPRRIPGASPSERYSINRSVLDQSDFSLYLAKYHSNAMPNHARAVPLLSLLFSDIVSFYHSNNEIQRLMLFVST